MRHWKFISIGWVLLTLISIENVSLLFSSELLFELSCVCSELDFHIYYLFVGLFYTIANVFSNKAYI
jgi:hypothetical protein